MEDPGLPLSIAYRMTNVVEVLDDLLRSTPQRKCSVGYLIRLALESKRLPITYGEDEVRAGLVVAVERGFIEYRAGGLDATDGTPWVVSTLVEDTRGLRHG